MSPLRRYCSFESYWEFEAFDNVLAQQLAAGQLVAAAQPLKDSTVLYQSEAWYQLSGTSEIWVLSTPDNAWRGYFLPLTEALAHQQQLRRRDQRGKMGCLALILLVGAIIVWQAIRLSLNSLPTVSP
jgi:hypothetical protein